MTVSVFDGWHQILACLIAEEVDLRVGHSVEFWVMMVLMMQNFC
jgi:hypothetical protein